VQVQNCRPNEYSQFMSNVGGHIREKCYIEQWNGEFSFQLEIHKLELIKMLEIMTLIRVRGKG
jgi:hypothetical protein